MVEREVVVAVARVVRAVGGRALRLRSARCLLVVVLNANGSARLLVSDTVDKTPGMLGGKGSIDTDLEVECVEFAIGSVLGRTSF